MMTRWDLSAQRLVGHFADGVKVDILSRSNLAQVALGVPATFTSASFEQQALQGAAVTMTVASADLVDESGGKVTLDGGKSVRLPGGAVYPFTPVSAAGVVPPAELPGAAMTVVSGFIQAGDDGAVA